MCVLTAQEECPGHEVRDVSRGHRGRVRQEENPREDTESHGIVVMGAVRGQLPGHACNGGAARGVHTHTHTHVALDTQYRGLKFLRMLVCLLSES